MRLLRSADLRGPVTTLGIDWPLLWKTVLLLAVLAAVCVVIGLAFPENVRAIVYGEEGSICEWVSVVQWALLALALPLIVGRMSWGITGAMMVLLACAAREADLHKVLTGYSVLKPKFYFSGEFPIHQRAIAAVIVGAVLAGLVLACAAMKRHAEREGWLRARWVRFVAFAVVLGAVSKVFDRAPASLKDFGVPVSETAQGLSKAVEENFEMLMPFVLLGAAVAFRRARRGSEDM